MAEYTITIDDASFDITTDNKVYTITLGSVNPSFGSLSDVTITTPSNGDIVVYNSGVWVNSAGGAGTGDMTKAVYDPTNVNDDAFDMDNMVDGETYVKTTNDYTSTEKSKLSGIEEGAEVNNISDENATDLTGAGDSILHYHAVDRNRANHTGIDSITNSSSNPGITITNSGTGKAMFVDQEDTSNNAILIKSDEIFTGFGDNALTKIEMTNASTTGTLLELDSDGSGDCLKIKATNSSTPVYIDNNGNNYSLRIDSEQTTSNVIHADGNNITSGTVINAFINNENFTGSVCTLTADHASGSGNVLTLNQDGTGKYISAGNFSVGSDSGLILGQYTDIGSYGDKITGQTVGGSDGDLVYLSSSETWSQADASAESTCDSALGIRMSSTEVLFKGIYTTTGLTAGAVYYASETSGAITATAPSTSTSIVRVVGYALSTTELLFDPDKTYIEVA